MTRQKLSPKMKELIKNKIEKFGISDVNVRPNKYIIGAKSQDTSKLI